MKAAISKRDKNIYEMKNNIKQLSKKYDALVDELRLINEQRIIETKRIISDTQARCDKTFYEQKQKLRQESEDTIKKIRSDAEKVLNDLDNNVDEQLEEISQQILEKLFKNLGDNR